MQTSLLSALAPQRHFRFTLQAKTEKQKFSVFRSPFSVFFCYLCSVMRYFIELKYDGANYCGWQRQTEVVSLQQTIEQVLSMLLRQPTEIVGAGRTDTGVNASYYVAHFDCSKPIDVEHLRYKLNLVLPHDIAIISITAVGDTAHARFDAVEREYTYYISTAKNPFRRHSAWIYYVPLDIDKMNEAARSLL